MIRIVKATTEHSKEISKLMLSELEKYDSQFPKDIMNNFKEHAKKENIINEFNNSNIIAFISRGENEITGFVVGYKDNIQKNAMIHYIMGNAIEKKKLLNCFIKECKLRKLNKIITDTFEFMDNNNFFKSNNFILIRKEEFASKLEMLWYEFNLD